jgi:dipeptidyl aminopeptidase/acylaminoacyl peptidase
VYAANYDFAAKRTIETSPLYRHDLQTGERLALARPQRANWTSPRLNLLGTHVLYLRNDRHPAGEQLWLVDIEGREDREIVNAGDDRKVSASWLPDGRRILVLAECEAYRRVGIWHLDDGSLRWVLDDPARNVEAAYVPMGSDRAVILEYAGARCRASFLDLRTGDLQPLPALPGDLVPLAPAAAGGWVGRYGSSTQPDDLVRFRPEQADAAAFASLTRIWDRTPIRPELLAPAEDFRWRSVDGREIQGWLYRARGIPSGTVICVHGGPTGHSRDEMDPEIQFLVSQGFNVLDPNYRGSTGFGRAYQEAIKEDGWGGREQDDIRTGIEALLAAGIAEPGKVGMTGTSYGGYSSWCGITRLPRRLLAASAPICGMTDLVVDYDTTRPDLRPYSEEMMGGRPDQVPDRYRERSPLHFVSQIAGRLLIVQGLRDPNVTPENVRVVREALDRAGIAYEVLVFEDEGHGISRPENLRVLYRRLATFFRAAFEPGQGP